MSSTADLGLLRCVVRQNHRFACVLRRLGLIKFLLWLVYSAASVENNYLNHCFVVFVANFTAGRVILLFVSVPFHQAGAVGFSCREIQRQDDHYCGYGYEHGYPSLTSSSSAELLNQSATETCCALPAAITTMFD